MLTFVILALLLELLVFYGLSRPSFIPRVLLPAFRLYYQSGDRKIIQVTSCGQYDSTLFYVLAPGTCQFSNREFNVSCHVNSRGLRDDEQSLSSPIVVLGDSYAMGWGVEQDEAFPQVLEKISQQRVLNAGISSYGTAREVLLFNRLALPSVKTIFIQYHANDFDENQNFLIKHSLPVRSGDAYDSICRNIGTRNRYFPFKHLYGISNAVTKQILYDPATGRSDAAAATTFLQVISNLNVDKQRVQLVVFKVDDYDYIDNGFINAIDSLAQRPPYREWNLSTLSIKDILGPSDYFVLDDHINREGHRKIGSKLAKALNPVLD